MRTHTCVHTHMCMHTQTCTQVCTHRHMCSCSRAHACMCTHTPRQRGRSPHCFYHRLRVSTCRRESSRPRGSEERARLMATPTSDVSSSWLFPPPLACVTTWRFIYSVYLPSVLCLPHKDRDLCLSCPAPRTAAGMLWTLLYLLVPGENVSTICLYINE